MNAERVDFLIELGDFKDHRPTAGLIKPGVAGKPPVEQRTLSYLQVAEKVLQGFSL